MGSTSFLNKKPGFRKSGSSAGSDKEMNGKLKRSKIRRPVKMNEYGMKRVPDYTELAYKEAVSKLRYFLSGNSAPSVRSYGGSASIKNLDECDGDLDKKYSTSFNTLSEFKPRPRLTAKYTTLYADSLNNYTPPQPTVNTAPPAASADLSGGTNPDVINFIQKQEEYIEQLERESQYCRDELNNLLGKVKEVISENENLHEAQKNKLISRMFHTYNAESETDDLDDIGDSTGLDSDNKISPSKTRRPKSRSSKLEGPNIVFESRIAELEAQLAQAKIDLKKVQEENNENKRKLASGLVDSTCLDGFKRQIDNLQRDKTTLESQISKLKLSLEQKDGDVENRYKRGSDAVEQQLREERNNLELEIRRLKDDLAKERSKVRELAGEGARRAIQERSAAEQRYNAHFDELQNDLAAQYDNAAKLQLELERQRREENDLKRELSMKNAAVEELKMELKNKCASLQADLAQAYAEKASLEEELASARLAIERQQRQSKHEANRLNSEIQSLRQRLDRADADLVHSRRENLRLSEQISNLEKELNMKNLTPISPEKNKKEKELSTMLESMENKHAKTVADLESMIHSQNSLMEKLSSECRLLTNKLDDANRRHKQELATLQRQVEGLGKSLQSTYSHQPSNYEAPSSHTPAANRISHSSPSAGPNYTRTESPNNAALRRNSNILRDDVGNYETRRNVNEGQINDQNNDSQNYVEESHEEQIYDTEMGHDQQNFDSSQDQEHFDNQSEKIPQNYETNVEQDQYNPDEAAAPEVTHTQNLAKKEALNEDQHVNIGRKMSKQNSRESVAKDQALRKQLSKDKISPKHSPTEVNDPNNEPEYNVIEEKTDLVGGTENFKDDQSKEKVEYVTETEKPIEEQTEQYEQNYDQNYEQNYEQNYDQNYEEPQYTEQYENYEQYPQQYDPNTQYEQYGNYPEGYTEQTYDNTQYNQEYPTKYPQNAPESESTNEKLASQS